MARIAGVDIPKEKRVVIALTYVFGIGKTRFTRDLSSLVEFPKNKKKLKI